MKWFKSGKSSNKNVPSEVVRVADIVTNEVITIPARELAPYMVKVKMEGIEGTVWIDSRTLIQSDFKHPPFPEEIRDYFREIKSCIDEFYCLSLDEWEDGFRRDTNPNREIASWLYLARLYRQLTTERDLSAKQRLDYFRLLITCLNSPREHVLNVYSPQAISNVEALNVIDQFFTVRD